MLERNLLDGKSMLFGGLVLSCPVSDIRTVTVVSISHRVGRVLSWKCSACVLKDTSVFFVVFYNLTLVILAEFHDL